MPKLMPDDGYSVRYSLAPETIAKAGGKSDSGRRAAAFGGPSVASMRAQTLPRHGWALDVRPEQ